LDRTLQERGPHWFGLLAGHGAYSAGACRALCIEAEFRHRGRHRARTCPLNRQGTAAAALPHACFSKGCSSTVSSTPQQHLWGSKAHTQAHTHTHAHTHIHSRSCTCAHTLTQTRARIHTGAHTHIHMRTHKHTDTRAHTCTRTNAQAHTRSRCARDGLRQFFSVASDALTLVYKRDGHGGA
jgi:hypothetical protein